MAIARRVMASLSYRSRKALGMLPTSPSENLAPASADPAYVTVETPTTYRAGYSAYGEDTLVLSWFNHFSIDPETITYVDVGAAHPWKLSNTFLFYQHGASGVLVEPDPDQAAVLREIRPRDAVANVGAAFDERRSAKITRFTSRVFNTFSDEQAELVLSSSKGWGPGQEQKIVDRVEVPIIPLGEIVATHMQEYAPDFISIDVESKDLQVLGMLDIAKVKPLTICIEAQRDRTACDSMLLPHGYLQLANTPDNFLYMLDPYGPAWRERAARKRK